jgi:hypothetical protein
VPAPALAFPTEPPPARVADLPVRRTLGGDTYAAAALGPRWWAAFHQPDPRLGFVVQSFAILTPFGGAAFVRALASEIVAATGGFPAEVWS